MQWIRSFGALGRAAGMALAATLPAVFLLGAAHAAPEPVKNWTGRDPTAEQTPGAQVYRTHCAACHEAGSTAPGAARSPLPLTSPLWIELRAHNFVHPVLDGIDGSDGLPGAMPAFRDKLTDDELAMLTDYVRAWRTNALGWPALLKDLARIRAKPVSQP